MKFMEKLLVGEKVEWKKLGKIKEIRILSPSKKIKKQEYLFSGKYPIIDQGQNFIVGYTNDETSIFPEDEYVIFGDHTESIKYVDFKFSQGADGIKVMKTNDNYIKTKYLYHVILNYYKKTGKYMRHFSLLKDTEIPIPSLKIQEKIVKILDNFTKYVTKLQAELQSRNKQYNYYRDMLLSEDYLNKISEKLDSLNNENYVLRLTTLGEIGKFTRGNGLQKKDFREKGKPVIHYGQIYTQYSFSTENTISFTEEDIFSKLRKAKPNDVLIATTSENIEDVAKSTVWLGNEEIGFSGDMYSYSTNENSKYIAYYFQTAEFQKQKELKVTGTKLIRIHGSDMEKFTISLPPIEIQNEIVKILDRFQELLSDTKGLLPLEIEQRRKQYEYYREKLLTFDKEEGYALSTAQHSTAQRQITSEFFELLKEAGKVVGIDVSDKVEWKKLSEVAKYHDGTHQTPNYTQSGVPFVSVQNIKDLYSTNKFISLEDFQKYKAKPEKNDIFMTRIGDVGTCALVKNNENLAYYVTLTLIKPNCTVVLSKFLKYFI